MNKDWRRDKQMANVNEYWFAQKDKGSIAHIIYMHKIQENKF